MILLTSQATHWSTEPTGNLPCDMLVFRKVPLGFGLNGTFCYPCMRQRTFTVSLKPDCRRSGKTVGAQCCLHIKAPVLESICKSPTLSGCSSSTVSSCFRPDGNPNQIACINHFESIQNPDSAGRKSLQNEKFIYLFGEANVPSYLGKGVDETNEMHLFQLFVEGLVYQLSSHFVTGEFCTFL